MRLHLPLLSLLLPSLLCSCGDDPEAGKGGSGAGVADDTGDGGADGAETWEPQTIAELAPWIDTLAGDVSQDELTATIAELAALETRYTGTDGNAAAQTILVDRLEGYGLEVEVDPFEFGGSDTEATNIIARLPGTTDPDVVWILSAHYDSTSASPQSLAPGADDNGSGVAAVLEAARLLSTTPHHYSLWFVLTGAEEQGSKGSDHMVGWLPDEDVDIRGVIAPDMIGYWPLESGDAFDILGDTDSEHLVVDMAEVADLLGVSYKPWVDHDFCYGDDHSNFQESGFPAITPMDCVEAHNVPAAGESLPHYHQATDTLDTLHMPFTTRVSSVLVTTLSAWGQPVDPE
jgi:hypothetical protein